MNMGAADAETVVVKAVEKQEAVETKVETKVEIKVVANEETETKMEGEEEGEEEAAFALRIAPPGVSVEEVDKLVRLEQVGASDTVLSLRQLLAEFPELACYTCYHLEAPAVEKEAEELETEATIKNVVKTVNSSKWVPMNDYVEMAENQAIGDDVVLRMVLEKYDVRKVRAHVRRLRDVLQNPPIPQIVEGKAEDTEAEKAPETPVEEMDEKAKKELAEKQLKKLREIHAKLENVNVPVQPKLSEFYTMALADRPEVEETAGDAGESTSPKSSPKSSKRKDKKKKVAEKKPEGTTSEASVDAARLPKCLKSLVFSGFNPPPGPRKLAGDLLYLEVTTEDNVTHFVTAHVDGFFENRSTKASFDPRPKALGAKEHLLISLLQRVSPAFKESYETLLAKAATLARDGPMSIELMVAAGNQIGGTQPWNSAVSDGAHEYNLNRAEDELCSTFGMDERGVLRDWNEEYQCCRELPADNLKEQVVRSRVMYKIVTEFVEAATQGAVAIVEGHIPPINPMDDSSAHVYVFNNIFFSLSIDGKPTQKDVAGEETAFSTANRDLQGVKAFNEADIRGLHTLATTVVDYLGMRVIAQSVIPGILQGEAASKLVYGSVDGGKTVASNPKMHELMLQAGEKLHIAERRVQPLGKDSSEETDEAVVGGEAGTDPVDICGPVDAKGILGSDGRMYVLDLVRITPKDATFYGKHKQSAPKEEDDSESPHFKREDEGYVAVLRPELVQLYSMWMQNQARKAQLEEKRKAQEEKKKNETAEGGDDKTDEKVVGDGDQTQDENPDKEDSTKASGEAKATEEDLLLNDEDLVPIPPVRLNPNVFMKYAATSDEELAKADEEAACDAAEYLQKVVIPAFVADIRRGSMAPADGRALTEMMHSCGINMRYLGRLASLCKKLETFGGITKYFLELLEVEMIARVAKRMVADLLNKNDGVRPAPGETLVKLLNAVLGGWGADESEPQSNLSEKNPNNRSRKNRRKKKHDESSGAESEETSESESEASSQFLGESVWERIATMVQNRFDYTLSIWTPYKPKSATEEEIQASKFNRVHKNVLLRRLCQRLGWQVASKDYDYSLTAPFAPDDLVGVVPVVKSSLPLHPLLAAKKLLERGRFHLSAGGLATAYELFQETSSLLFQVVGGAHEDAALCGSSLATVMYHAGDLTGAIAQQQRALALYTQLEGLDYHETAMAHASLGLFLHANGQTDQGVMHMRRAIYLLELCAGPHFPEISTLYFKMGMMCQDVGLVTLALFSYRESLHRGEFDRLQAANALHQMALACSMIGGYRDALNYEKRVYSLLNEAFGDEDPRVVESHKFVAKFTEMAVEGAKGRREVDAAAAADAIAKELLDELAIKEESETKKKGKKSKK